MAWTKAKTMIVASAVVLLTVGVTTIVMTRSQPHSLDTYLQDPQLNDISNAPPMAAVQPTHFPTGKLMPGGILGRTVGNKEIGRDVSLTVAILKAYRISSFNRIIRPDELNRTKVDYLVTVPDQPYEKFQAEIKRVFGYIAHIETREMDVLLLRLKRQDAPGLTPAENYSWTEWAGKHPNSGGIYQHNVTASTFAKSIEGLVSKPVVDQTGLTGNYDFLTKSFRSEEIKQVFLDQLGLELVPSREPIEMLVVEKVK